MSTYRSPVTSCAMSSSGNSGARSAGPTGCIVPGCSGGGGGLGRAGTTLYHCVGTCDSSSMILCCSSAMASPPGPPAPVRRRRAPPAPAPAGGLARAPPGGPPRAGAARRGPPRRDSGRRAALGQAFDAVDGDLHVLPVLVEAALDDALLLVGARLDGDVQPRGRRAHPHPLPQQR